MTTMTDARRGSFAGSPPSADTVDLADLARTVRRQWKAIAAFVTAGLIIAVGVVLFAPRQFEGTATVVVRAGSDPAGSLLSQLGGAGGGVGGLIAGSMRSPIETELQVLQSRALMGQLVDSLNLQVYVAEPRGVASTALVRSVDAPGTFRAVEYVFERAADGRSYKITSEGFAHAAIPGALVQLPSGRLTLADSLPAEFTLQLFDREDAVTRTLESLNVAKAGGEVVRVSFRASDSVTAARATNALIATYLGRRKTSDRGSNLDRVDFLGAQLDTIALELATAEQALRRHQERSGVIDAPVVGKLQLEQAAALRKEIGAVQVEEGALSQLLGQVASGRVSARQLSAYPTFLKSSGINDLIRQLSGLETERTRLLERRLETDPEVVAVTQSIEAIEGQLVPIATSYTTALRRQRSDMRRQLDTLQMALATFPAAAQSTVRLQRDVLRLGQIHGALQAQLVDARLAAITEGGDVRQLDVAAPPKEVVFPAPMLTMGMGLGGGLLLGLIAALAMGTMGRYMDDPRLIERATGVPTLPLGQDTPLLVSGSPLSNTVLLIPLGDHVSTAGAADRMAQTALARATPATVLDLSAGDTAMHPEGVNAAIDRLEQAHGMVIVRLPGLRADVTAAALHESRPVFLVASDGRVDRTVLLGAVETLRRLDIPCAGVVLHGGGAPGRANGRLRG